MGQHHKLPMSGDFSPKRNSNEKQEGFLQLRPPHLLHNHSKAVHSGISSVLVLPKVHLIPLFVVIVVFSQYFAYSTLRSCCHHNFDLFLV
jgi:hypothetical protein